MTTEIALQIVKNLEIRISKLEESEQKTKVKIRMIEKKLIRQNQLKTNL